MRFPTGADYVEALQHPATCFEGDEDLAAGAPVLGPLGLPTPVSGNFACVFRVDGRDGRSFAVRCFTRWFDDQTRRYEAIAGRLAELRPPWQVGFEFVRRGIRVGDAWYPVLKMPWVEAEPLLSYVERNLWDTATLAYLGVRFAELVGDLRSAGIAHGDLQHGNILVAAGGPLRLIDYDGMYVPELAGLASNEVGHRNYQHPGRDRSFFGPELDHFASWVIYGSLVALSVDPVLWGRLDGGDECLLFRRRDFVEPARSEALASFEATGDPRLADVADLLRQALGGPAPAVPPLLLASAPTPAVVAPHAAGATPAALAERRRLLAVLRGDAAGDGDAAPSAPDLDDDAPLPPPPPVVPKEFGPAIRLHRRLLLTTTTAVLVFLALGALGRLPFPLALVLAVAAAGGSALLARHQFHSMPEVRAIRPQQDQLAALARAAAVARTSVDELARRRRAADRIEEEAARRLADAEEQARQEERGGVSVVETDLRRALAELADREQELHRLEQRDRGDALRQARLAALDAQLRNHSLATARIPHVPDTLVYALGLDSVRTAADFVDVVLDEARTGSRTAGASLVLADGRRVGSGGLGAEQARQLLRWRRTLESKYTFAQPAGLADDASAAIRQSYAGRRKAVEAEQARLRATARGEVDALRERLRRRLDVMGGEVRTVQRGAAGTRLRLDREVAGARKQAAEAEWRRAAAERELDSYAGLTFAAFVRAVARLTAVGDEPLN